MKIAIIGTGSVGITLATSFLKNGQEVKFGARSPDSDKTKAAVAEVSGATVGTVHEAIAWADAIVLATASHHDDEAIKEFAESLGPGVGGKLIADATNPWSGAPAFEWRWEYGTSSAEVLQEALPTAKVAKMFNTTGTANMTYGTTTGGQKRTMLIACDPSVKDTAKEITRAGDLDPVYVGPIRYARNLEAIAELWVHMCMLKTSGELVDDKFHFQFISDHIP